MPDTTLSVVIPSKNEEREIGTLLKSISIQTLQPSEVIVADKSTDKTREIARSFGAIVTEGVDDGRVGYARNKGYAKTTGEFICFFDADIELGLCTFLEDAVICMDVCDYDICSCYYRPTQKNWKTVLIFGGINLGKKIDSLIHKGIGSGGAVIIIRRSAFEKLGGFDEKLKISEDLEFTTRAVSEGLRFGVLPLYVWVSSRRFAEHSPLTIIRTLIGGAGTVGGSALRIPFLKKHQKKFEEWYGETGGDAP